MIAFVLNGMLFLLGAWGFINDQKLFFAAIQLLASLLNFGMIWNLRKGLNKSWLELTILFMNIIVALTVAIDYIQAGKTYIQYAWFFAAFMSAIAFLIKANNNRKVASI